MIDLTITIKDEERKLTKKEQVPLGFDLSFENPTLHEMVRKLFEEFGGHVDLESPKITVKSKFDYQK